MPLSDLIYRGLDKILETVEGVFEGAWAYIGGGIGWLKDLVFGFCAGPFDWILEILLGW